MSYQEKIERIQSITNLLCVAVALIQLAGYAWAGLCLLGLTH